MPSIAILTGFPREALQPASLVVDSLNNLPEEEIVRIFREKSTGKLDI